MHGDKIEKQLSGKEDIEINLPSIIPRNHCRVVCVALIFKRSSIENCWAWIYISSTVVSIATFATLPTVELKDKIAPILIVLGLFRNIIIGSTRREANVENQRC